MAKPKRKKKRGGSVPTKACAKRSNRKKAKRSRAEPALARLKHQVAHLRYKLREKAQRKNPRRPPRRWFDRCLASVEARHYARDPAAVCGAAWWRTPTKKRAAIVRRLERGTRRERRAAVAIAKAEHRRHERQHPRKPNPPRKLVQLVYRERKPGDDREYDYEHDFDGELPDLRMRGGAIQIDGGSYRTKKGWIHG